MRIFSRLNRLMIRLYIAENMKLKSMKLKFYLMILCYYNLHLVQKMLKLDKREVKMEELKHTETKGLRRRLGHGAKSALEKGMRKVSPYMQKALTFVLFLSSNNISAQQTANYSNYDNEIKTELSIQETPRQSEQAADLLSMTSEMSVFTTLDECRKIYGEDFKLDISQMQFSMSDLELAEGKESKTAQEMVRMALKVRTPTGYCTRNSKQTFRRLGWVQNLSEEDKKYFDNIVPAWELLPLLQEGKIGPLTEIHICKEDLESKTTPIPLLRVNEAGETKNAHTQIMCSKGAVYGGGRYQGSPEYHKERGKRQKYGTAHFFVDKETIEAVVAEVTKNRDDVMLVCNPETKTVAVVALDNVPQDYRLAVAQYRIQKQSLEQDRNASPDFISSAMSQVPRDLAITPLNQGKINRKPSKMVEARISKGGFSNG